MKCCLVMCPASGYAKIIRHCMKRGIWTPFTLSAYQHLLGTERHRALDNVLQELGRERTIAMSLPEFEQSLFMAAQPDNLLLATAPRYCQYYNQLHQLPLVALPLPFDESQQKSWKSLLPCCGINGTAIIRRSSGYGKPLKIFTRRWHNRIV